MIALSAFADEISPDPEEQCRVLLAHGIRHIDLRGAWGTNVLDLTDGAVARLRHLLRDAGIRVAAIASPIGKTPIDGAESQFRAALERALDLAERFDAPCLRVFSFYPPAEQDAAWPRKCRDAVMARLWTMAEAAERRGVILLHENEKGIYGDTIARCADIVATVGSVKMAFDPANFIQCGEAPFPDAYQALHAAIGYVHVKDALAGGSVVPAGQGMGRFPELLARLRTDGYEGVLSLEPHLAEAGPLEGFTGPERFGEAVAALRGLLDAMGWRYD